MLRPFGKETYMFDKIKFYQAAALIRAIRANLPEGLVWMNHVDDYHSALSKLEELIKVDLSDFRIPESAITRSKVRRDTYAGGFRFTKDPETVPVKPYCDPIVFKRQLEAVHIFIETYMQDLQSNQK
jgi:hypothetical protein